MSLFQIFKSLSLLLRSNISPFRSDTLTFYPEFEVNKSVAKVFNAIVNSPLPNSTSLTIITPELHLQSMLEAALLLRNKTTDFQKKPSLKLGWTMIDNLLYGFYSDYDAFTVKPKITDSHIRPDIILFDDNRSYPPYYDSVHKSGKTLFRSGPLSLVDTRSFYSKKINE